MQHRRVVFVKPQTSIIIYNDSCGDAIRKVKNPTAFRFRHIETVKKYGFVVANQV